MKPAAHPGRIGLALVGTGAFGLKHLDGLRRIDGVDVVSLIGRDLESTRAVASRFGVAHVGTELEEALACPDVDAVILCTPTHLHAAQASACILAGKHVQVEIPLADRLVDAERLASLQVQSGLVVMCGHTRRFNPGHQYVHQRIANGQFNVQQLVVQTFFFRRRNINALGQPRSWTDHLLWHHAAHTVDLFAYQCGRIVEAHAVQGPVHPELGIAMDMSIQLRSVSGAICSLSLSFNNDGPLGSVFRYIGDSATYVARYDDLFDGNGERIEVAEAGRPIDGVELQDRDFIEAVRQGREPKCSVHDVLPCYRLLHALEQQLNDPVELRDLSGPSSHHPTIRECASSSPAPGPIRSA